MSRARRKAAASAGAPGRVRKALATHWYAWTMVAPVVLVIGVIIGYPLVRGLYLSLTDANEANVERNIGMNHIPATYRFTGLDNYTEILGDGVFWSRLGWTVVWTVACVGLTFAIGLTLANLLNRKLRGRTFYRLALILPWAIPAFVSVFTWRLLYNEKNGLLNKLLAGGGIDAVPWLNDPTWAKLSVIAVNVWLGVPFMLVALLGGLQSIPGELYEAAEMDGAGAWQRFRNITLPSLRGVSSTVILLSTIWTFNMFPVIYLLTRGGPGDATEILVTYAYRLSFVDSPRDFSGSAAWGVLILLLLSMIAVVYRRSLRKQGEVW
ncbi:MULTISPECIES: carbohydrate ABC transporter permease [Streptomyces]|uniref:Sugar ABC transporter permease n=2 Tax=Streptomyces rimosus subsp. rimosus TaxID=132474 RepID=A0A8A1V5B3_STRR1|nr:MULTISPECIES: sugar ABC transporter permease [Streptomyces]KOG84319.1 ABC transporter permease [Kitasatospora aureofaciens]MYT46342.1 ABC transporter permease subunit [Streptomyces sp. SID5471]KOT28045.1 ABC transporter permease [Streptomyces sp. NRRL WC-3701]KOT42344.1 ABC transporter permease [Streptomyces rimosus subsp. rimosus]KOT58054.1 ABC transporter permease [Streptomyces rimosus subsp. rimosus]